MCKACIAHLFCLRPCQALSIARRGLPLEHQFFLSAKMLNPYSFNILVEIIGIILIWDFEYLWSRPSTDTNSLLIPVGGMTYILPRICRLVFHSYMFLDLLWERFCCSGQNFLFLLNSSISWEIQPPYTVHSVTHVPLELG